MMIHNTCSMTETDAAEAMAEMFGPSHVDQMIRQAVQYCWMSLPRARRKPEELANQIHRLVARALNDFAEDQQAFGAPK
jgi:hypothetical protein